MKDSFIFYKSFYDAIKNIPDEEQLKLFKSICDYCFGENEIELEDGIAKALFILIKPNIDSANARYKASVENGKKGGRPKTQQKPNNNLNVDVYDNVYDNIYNKEIDNNKLLSMKKDEELINKLIENYNSLNVFPKVMVLTEKRKRKIKSRLKDVGYDNLIKAFNIASESDFLTGKNDNKWKADFDWFICNDTNCIKVLENKYKNKQERTIYETI